MRTLIGTIALVLVFLPFAHAEETIGDKAREAKTDAVEAKREAGRTIRSTGREIKKTGRKVRQAVIFRCADGRHTARRAAGCARHGGVRDPK
jgi:hypothetical protein